MNKTFIVRGSIVLSILILAILIPVMIEGIATNEKTPELTNGADTYLTVDGVTVTNDDLWKTMRNIDGVDYLLDYTLEYLLEDEIAAVLADQDAIDAEIRLLTYLTEDEETIAQIMEDEEIHQDYLDAFRQNITVLGYDPEDQDSLNEFVSLSIAKRRYVEALYLEAEEGNAYYVSEDDVTDYYDENAFGDVCSLEIRFSSADELTALFAELDLVANHNNSIGEYIGLTPYEDLLQGDFNDDNTNTLDADGVWGYYVEMYNIMNPWAPQLPANITQEDYCANYADIAVKNYEDMTEYKADGNPELALATYLFETLDLDAGVTPYTYTTTKTFSDYTVLAFKVSQDEVTAYEDLDQATKDMYREEYIKEEVVTDTIISSEMDDLLVDNGFEIFDPLLKLKYTHTYEVEFDNKGSETLVAKVDGKDITVDEFFTYMDGRIGVFYSIETAKAKVLLNSEEYTELFGESHDYFSSDNEDVKGYVTQLEEMKALFGTNYYANYGFSSADMEWEEFLYLAFGLETENDVLENMFIIPALQNAYMFDQIEYNDAVAYMEDQIEKYFSLNVSHILIYIDFDFDFVPDDFPEYRESLSGQEATDFQALLVAYENLITSKITGEDALTLSEVVAEYNGTLMTDTESEWYEFKQAGFFMKTEELGEIDQISALQLDEDFAGRLKELYDEFVVNPDVATTTEVKDDQIVISEFGVHLITVQKGSNFDQLTAAFEDTDETGDPENDAILPTQEQIDLYLEIKYAEVMGDNTTANFSDADVLAAIEYYYGTVYSAYTSQTAFGAEMGQYIIDNNGEYATGSAEKLAELQILVDTLNEVNYPELFGTEE